MSILKTPRAQKVINDFFVEHAPLIHKHVNILKSKGLIPPNVQEEDLDFAGFHGLMDAINKFDPEVAERTSKPGENAFAKYAEQRIKGKMLDHIASQDKIPRGTRIKAKNLLAQQSMSAPRPVAQQPEAPVAIPPPAQELATTPAVMTPVTNKPK